MNPICFNVTPNSATSLMAEEGFDTCYQDELYLCYSHEDGRRIMFRLNDKLYYPGIFELTPSLHQAITEVMKELRWIEKEDDL